MRNIKLFTIGILLTLAAILGDNSYKRAMLFTRLTYQETQIVQAGEAMMEGILCGIVCIIIFVIFFWVWGLIP